ncbi:septation protein SpoVG family protein [bacterium]|nr:septation protein SpoVG family protein [bacterium]
MLQDLEIRQIVKFTGEGSALASVTFRIGSIVVRNAKLMETEGRRWLAMPARKMGNGNWFSLVSFGSYADKKQLEELVSHAYDTAVQNDLAPELIPAF